MKNILTLGAVLLAVTALTACKEEDSAAVMPVGDECGASSFQALVGQDEAAVAEAGIEAGPKARIFGPDAVLTMDFRQDRINVELDEAGKVVRIYCG